MLQNLHLLMWQIVGSVGLQMERDKAEAERVKTEKKAELVRKQEEAKQKAETAKKVRAEETRRKKLAAEAAQRSPSSPIRFIGLPDDEDDLHSHQVANPLISSSRPRVVD